MATSSPLSGSSSDWTEIGERAGGRFFAAPAGTPLPTEPLQVETYPLGSYDYYAAAADLGYDLTTHTFKGVKIA